MPNNLLFIFSLILLLLPAFPASAQRHAVWSRGGIIRTDTTSKRVTLIFTGAHHADGADAILRTLREERVKGAFFLTGHFIERYPQVVSRLVDEGHYVGSHSYGHLLYFPWDSPQMSVTRQEFEDDIRKSYQALEPYGITVKKAPYFVPPYEHYNDTVSAWAADMGLTIINFTPGSTSNADYTTPQMKNYRSSQTIYDNILRLESEKGLNGHLLLFHIGTVDARTDKFYNRHLGMLVRELKQRGYRMNDLKKRKL